jgi:hypothetical protein
MLVDYGCDLYQVTHFAIRNDVWEAPQIVPSPTALYRPAPRRRDDGRDRRVDRSEEVGGDVSVPVRCTIW